MSENLQIYYFWVSRSFKCKEIFTYYWRDRLKLD